MGILQELRLSLSDQHGEGRDQVYMHAGENAGQQRKDKG